MAKVLTNLLFKGSTVVLDETADFPANPEIGQFCFKGGVLYIFAIIDTLETWYPLTNKNSHFVFTQGISSTSWVISHNLQSTDLIFMAYDENDVQIVPSGVTFNSDNQITLSFTEATKGRAIVFGATETYTPAISTAQLSVGNDISMSGTSIIVSGVDIVALLDQTKSDLDAMFSWNDTLGQITFKGDLIPENTGALSIGSATKKIKDLYVAAQTLHVGDNATFEGTSLAIDAGPSPTSLGDTPTIQASSLILKPFTYNPGAGNINVEPVLKFQNLGGQQYGISFNLIDNEFQLDSPSGVGTGSIKCQELTVNNKITADTIETTGTAQIKFDQSLRVDGDVTLGYDNNNDVIIRGIVDLQTPITFSEAATLGDGNDTISVNCGLANNFTVNAQNISVDAAGKLTATEIESTGDLTVQGDLFVNGTQTIVDTATLQVTDNVVVVNNGESGAGVTAGVAGISVDRGSLPDAKLLFDDSVNKWRMGIEGSMSDIEVQGHTHTTYLRNNADSEPATDNTIDLGAADKRFANIHALTFNGALNGNAATADQLSTSRAINLSGDATGSANFNGTGDANINVTVVDDSHIHDGRYYTETESNERFMRKNATSVPDIDLSYDLGDATHRWTNVFASNFKGKADTADKLVNARTVTLSGDVSGSFAFDGSGNVNATITVIDGSHNHDSQYYTQAECNANFVSLSGDVMTGDLQLGDNLKVSLGTSQDFEFYHDGTNNFIDSVGAASLALRTANKTGVQISGDVTSLFYNDTWRLQTTVDGIDVNGVMNGQASSALYADLAENLTCAEDFVYPGTVMKFCETGEFDVEECATEFARNVAGVVSENPAYLMNSEEKGVPVAYTGKVRVRVKGPVGKGHPIISGGMGVARGILKDSELLYSFGCTLEENPSEEEKLIMCVIK